MAFEISSEASAPQPDDVNMTEDAAEPQQEKKRYRVGIISVMIAFAAVFGMTFAVRLLDRAGVFAHLSKGASYAVFAAVTVCVYLVPGIVYTILRRKNGGTVRVFERSSPHTSVYAVLTCLLALATGLLCRFYLIRQGLTIVGDSYIAQMRAGDSPYLLLIFGVLPAFAIEYFFRGVMQSELTKIGGGVTGILVTSLASALCVSDDNLFVETLLVGLLLGLLAHVCGSFIPSAVVRVIIHSLAVMFGDRLRFVAAERAGNALTMILIVMLWLILFVACMRAGAGVCADKARRVELITAEKSEVSENAQPCTRESEKADTSVSLEASQTEPEKAPNLAGVIRHLAAPKGYTLHKFMRVLFSPAMIVCAALFALLAFR